jgi:16S rRNA (guanine1207-N2)-methyltransferase
MIQIVGTKNRLETYGFIAKAWQSAEVGAMIEIMQPNDRGGKTLEKNLRTYFPDAGCDSRQKARFITLIKTENTPDIITEWLEYTQLRLVPVTGFYSMPGLFGWDKIDHGSRILLETLPELKGKGADFGCGYGYLSKSVLDLNAQIEKLYGFDNDPRAIEASQKNIIDDRSEFIVTDCTKAMSNIPPLDFIISNPPFHDGDGEDRSLGQKFIIVAAQSLKKKGALWLVANKHMPYEKTLHESFTKVETVIQKDGFKIISALK